MTLTNIRQIAGQHGPEMAADFTIADGRQGSVTVSLRDKRAGMGIARRGWIDMRN